MDKRGRGSIKIFAQNFFCLTVPKNFIGEPFSVSLISGTERLFASESYITVCVEFFLSHRAENFVEEPF